MNLGIFISAFVLLLIQWNLRLRRPLAIVSDQLYSANSFPKYQKFPEVKSLYLEPLVSDNLFSANSFPKYQKFPSQITIMTLDVLGKMCCLENHQLAKICPTYASVAVTRLENEQIVRCDVQTGRTNFSTNKSSDI